MIPTTLETLVAGLEAAPNGSGFMARCPAHDDSTPSLSITESDEGRVLVHCHAGCSQEAVISTLRARGLWPQEASPGITIAAFCAAKRLPEPIARAAGWQDDTHNGKPCIRIPYKDSAGNVVAVQYRLALTGHGRFKFRKGDSALQLYGLEQLRPHELTLLVEGASDVLTARHHGFNCIGVASATSWDDERFVPSLAACDGVFVVVEPDRGGKQLRATLARSKLRDKLRLILMEEAAKDLSALYLQNPDGFKRRVEAAMLAARPAATDSPVTTGDFYAYMPSGNFIFLPTRELWPASSVNVRCADPGAADWIAENRPIDQMTWAPGQPALIEGRVVDGGGWVEREGFACLNLYRPPLLLNGDATRVQPWLAHLQKLYPGEFEHIVRWLAHRVQRPGEKVNHGIVLGGPQGIGKDSLLEPVKYAMGAWNFIEVSPAHLIGRFNGFVKSVILRVSEARDLGDIDRYAFYDHMKIYTAAPPDVLRCDEKNLREHYVMNVCGVIITTNHKTAGIYLPADDRRHHVSWSDLTKEDFSPEYWQQLWSWYGSGGIASVAAYLEAFNVTGWDPKTPPPKTEAFWDIVGANRAPEDAELADVLEQLGNPTAVTKQQLIGAAERRWDDIAAWLQDRRNARQVPHRMETVGYVAVRNEADQRDGLWKIDGNRAVIYALKNLSVRERHAAAAALVAAGRR